MKAIDVTDESFEQLVLNQGKFVLIEFGAEWCPPCKAMKPILDLLANDFEGKALIAKLDVDTNPSSTARYGVRNLPTFLLFKDGNLLDRIVGAVPKSILDQKIKSAL